jgi:Spy/CpxP family protein refolding chaperone
MTGRLKWVVISVVCSAMMAGGTAWFVTDWALHRHAESHTHDHVRPDFHAWMHEHLDITPEQHEKLEPIEVEFAELRANLRGEINAADLTLAAALGESVTDEAALNAALERLSKAQGALQRATLDHFLAMKRYLRPAQARKLVDWTHDSLTRD